MAGPLVRYRTHDSMPEVGDPAPAFSLLTTRSDVALRSFNEDGKLVLAFYVEDMTPG